MGSYSAGANGENTLAERWNGVSWTVVSTPNATTTYWDQANGVTCVSSTECWAVGYYNTGSGSLTLDRRVDRCHVDHRQRRGRRRDSNNLYGVTCWSATECWAVGRTRLTVPAPIEPLSRNGTEVLGAQIRLQTATAPQSLSTISLTCRAHRHPSVGPSGAPRSSCGPSQAIVEEWKGDSWQIVPSPASPYSELYGVTCAAPGDCWAVGSYFDQANNDLQTLIESWDGSAWTAVTSPNTSSTQSDVLNSVTCASSTECFTVGYYRNASNVAQTLIEQWDGHTWSILASTNGNTTQDNILDKVACALASECWAVGSDGQTLIELLDGRGVDHSNVSGMLGWLTQRPIRCDLPVVDCLLGGWFVLHSCWVLYANATEKWDGLSWTVVGSPNETFPSDGNPESNALNGVTCTSTSACWAVGSDDNSYGQTLVEQWSGASWTIVSSADPPGPSDSSFSATTCVSSSECWATGVSAVGSGPAKL